VTQPCRPSLAGQCTESTVDGGSAREAAVCSSEFAAAALSSLPQSSLLNADRDHHQHQ